MRRQPKDTYEAGDFTNELDGSTAFEGVDIVFDYPDE